MNKLRNLLMIQILIGVLFGVALAGFGLYMAKTLIAAEQRFHQNLIQQFSFSNLIDDPKLLSKQLKASIDFEFLTLKDRKNNILYAYRQDKQSLPTLTPVLKTAGLLTSPVSLETENGHLIVEFHSAYSNILDPLQTGLILAFIFPLIIILCSFLLFQSGCNQMFLIVAEDIAKVINNLIKNKSTTKSKTLEHLPHQFAPITISLKKLNSFFNNTMEEFEKSACDIKSEAYKDTLTNLPNRTQFVEHFETEINPPDKQNEFGIIILVRASELQHINQTKGYQQGDNYVKGLSEILINFIGTYGSATIYRLNSSDFGLIIPNITTKESETLAQTIHSRLNEYMRVTELPAIACMGIVSYGNGKPLGELLASADTAISLAQSKHVNAWHIHKDSDINNGSSLSFGNQNWRSIIEQVINNQEVTILFQSIQASNKGSKAYSEVLARFNDTDGQVVPTASLLAMAEKLNRVVDIDQLIIEKVLETIKNKNLDEKFIGINITTASVHNEQFMIWLERRLLKDAQLATKLIFEVTEYGLQQNVNSSRRFIDMVHRAGARVTVEKFGVGITSFKFFQELKPDYIKLDGSYTREIEEEKNNQYFIRMIVDLSHRIGVNVLAECVETQEEKHVLETLMVDGCQGYYIGKPSPV